MGLSARHGFFVASFLFATTPFSSAMVTLVPVKLTLSDVSFQYPATWFRRLVSAAPRRECALQNISLSVSRELVLVTGNSDSGKTTLFQLIRGEKRPTSGTVLLSQCDDQDFGIHLPKPVYLELSPDRSDSRATTLYILQTKLLSLSEAAAGESIQSDIIRCFCDILNYPDNALRMKRDQLSTSDNFKLEIILACLESIVGGSRGARLESSSTMNVCLPAPVLLLDEWLDKETTAVVHRVQDCLRSLANAGAVVCVVTHKPERWNLNQSRRLQLHRGRVDKDIPNC